MNQENFEQILKKYAPEEKLYEIEKLARTAGGEVMDIIDKIRTELIENASPEEIRPYCELFCDSSIMFSDENPFSDLNVAFDDATGAGIVIGLLRNRLYPEAFELDRKRHLNLSE